MRRTHAIADYDYSFPPESIAQQPASERGQSKLLIRSESGALDHRCFDEIDQILPEGALVIVNNSRVYPGRIYGRLETGGQIEILLLKPPHENQDRDFPVMAKPSRKLTTGRRIFFEGGTVAQVEVGIDQSKDIRIRFEKGHAEIATWLESYGIMPLPPYIKRPVAAAADQSDRIRYQTVYADQVGSIAAPTAGLHFKPEIIDRLKKRSIQLMPVTLHVGIGTFKPITVEDVSKHTMHPEWYSIPAQTIDAITKARARGKPIIGVGTTTFRTLEDIFQKAGGDPKVLPGLANKKLENRLYVYPSLSGTSYKPWCLDGLITNFHQPKSTLYLLICALIGLDEAKKMYEHAIAEGFRLFSYGDANFIKFSTDSYADL